MTVMSLIWLIVPVFFVQEFASTEATLVLAYRGGISLWVIDMIWIAATVIDIVVWFYVGKYVKERSLRSDWIGRTVGKWSARFDKYVGRMGERFSLILLGFITFPYLAAFIAPWFDLSPVQALTFVFLGDLLWYLFAWGTVFGISMVVTDIRVGIVLVVLVAIAMKVVSQMMLYRGDSNNKNGPGQKQ